MRRTLLIVLLLSASTVHAQSDGGQAGIVIGRLGNIAPIAYYAPSGSILDNYGNLIVFDFIYSYPPIMTGQTTPVRIPTIPRTRVIVVPPGGGTVVTKEYSATFQIIWAGQWAVYAIGTVYALTSNNQLTSTRSLVAMDVGVGGAKLPADYSGFPSTALPTRGDAKLARSYDGSPDAIYSVQPVNPPIMTLGSASPVALPRIARIITYNGTFKSVDVNLPQ